MRKLGRAVDIAAFSTLLAVVGCAESGGTDVGSDPGIQLPMRPGADGMAPATPGMTPMTPGSTVMPPGSTPAPGATPGTDDGALPGTGMDGMDITGGDDGPGADPGPVGGAGGMDDEPQVVDDGIVMPDLGGDCCPDGNCLCHGPDPTDLTVANGPYNVDRYRISTGTVFYPTDAEPPFAAIAICPGFLNSGPEMEPWGPFYASHGFVMVAVDTIGSDIPNIRAIKLLAAVDELKMENTNSGSPLFEKLAGRYGTSGYSMGGGGTTIASGDDSTLLTSVPLAAWGPVTTGVTVPTLLLCGSSDGVAPCSMSQGAYNSLPDGTPKMMLQIQGATHFNWFAPDAAGRGTSGMYALAFQKVYLAGDERWKPFLMQNPSNATRTTNIQ
ncbi:MAG: hypothetical protein OXT09_07885 [Myxococcales bacterium]|nr:hypothetical protein [Myxococcales bacterium]